MKQVAKILMLIVLNAFLLAVVSFIATYINLSNALVSINQTIPNCIENALQASMESEEMFYYSNTSALSSDNVFNSNTDTQNLVRYYTDGEWVQTDLYTLAYTIDRRGLNKLPQASELNFFSGKDETALMSAYSWLFSKEPVEASALDTEAAISSINSRKVPNDNLQNYFREFGDALKIQTYLYQLDPTDDSVTSMVWRGNFGDLTNGMINSLNQMGYDFGDTDLNGFTNNSIGSIVKDGKVKIDNTTNRVDLSQGSHYMLSPYSLGYTYLDERVVKPAIIANLTNTMALQRVSTIRAGVTSGGVNGANGVRIADSDEPITLSARYRTDGTMLSRDSVQLNIDEGTQDTFNNGLFEVNVALDQVDLDIKYATVNFYDTNSDEIKELVNTIEGRVPTEMLSGSDDCTSKRLMENDTKLYFRLTNASGRQFFEVDNFVPDDADVKGNRVVAKVTTTLDVNIPYSNAIMQWIRAFLVDRGLITVGDNEENHYGVLALEDSLGSTVTSTSNSEGRTHYNPTRDISRGNLLGSRDDTTSLEYRYVTYVAISR